MNTRTSNSNDLHTNALVLSLVCCKLLIHILTNIFGGYGYVRDEFYYIACSNHMAWGYVDQPPFSIAALWLSRTLFGDTLFALRLFPAVSGALVTGLTCLITREMGGKRYAQVLAALCVMAAPLCLGMDSVFSMNSFDTLFWTLALYLIVLITKTDEKKHWIALGITLGLGLLNKISVLWLSAGLVAGLLLTRHRQALLSRKAWIAAAIALGLFLPHILWQLANGFPTLEFIRNAGSNKYVGLSPLDLFVQQAIFMNPLTFPIWISGVFYVLISKRGRQFVVLPIIYITVFLILAINRNVKAEYLTPLIPMLFAMGALAFEAFTIRFPMRILKPLILVLVGVAGICLSPFVLAVLPVETFISYSKALGVKPTQSENNNSLNRLPQHYADMFGWEEMTAIVAGVYNSLSPEEKTKCAIMCSNYGEAGAIDFFGRRYGLPGAISGHNNYWLWGPRSATGEIVIRMGGSEDALKASYAEVVRAGIFTNGYCMPYENNMTLWICQHRHTPLDVDWARFKSYH